MADLREIQAPLKAHYRADPKTALITLKSEGRLGEGVSCSVATGKAQVEAGLHPAAGGSGLQACSGNMLLEALVACAGVTLSSVATAMGIAVTRGVLRAEGDLDFRGILGVDKTAPVGFKAIRLFIEVDCDATDVQRDKMLELTERYCVVFQTLKSAVPVRAAWQ